MNDLESAIFPLPEIRDCKCEDHTGYEAFHGTVSGYTHHRCDCLDCKMAIRAYIALPRNRAKQQQANASRDHARRARATGAMCEPYTRLQVAKRDNWICFCGGTIDSSLRWPNPWSFSIDHVVPIGAGWIGYIPQCAFIASLLQYETAKTPQRRATMRQPQITRVLY